MSLYSSIDRRINADKWFRALSRDAQLLFFRILSGPHVTQVPGLWAATEDGLAKAFGFSLEGFRESFTELTTEPSSNGLARVIADWDAGVIWLPNSLKQKCNQPSNPNVLKSWGTHLHLVPECELKDRGIIALKTWVESRPKRFTKGWPEGLPNPSAKGFGLVPAQEQEQDQDQKQDQELQEGGGAVLPFAKLVLEPRNLAEALQLEPRQRAQYATEHSDLAGYLIPQRWPEVKATHAAVVAALRLPERPLQDWGRDRGLQALVRLLAVAEPDYVISGAAALANDPWWKARRRGLSDLTAEVLTRALGAAPTTTDAKSASKLKAGPRQPNAANHSNISDEDHLRLIGGTSV